MKFAVILTIFSILLFLVNPSFGQTDLINSPQNTLQVSFVNNTATSYEIDLDSSETFMLSQKYSWVRDQNSRYNLVSYSLDGQDFSNILRQARGNFILDIPSDSSHTVIFSAVTQYPVSIQGVEEYSFSPKSPTNDNWFDAKSEIKIFDITSNNKGLIPYEIENWEGSIVASSGNSVRILVDGPISIEAKWHPNYSPLALYIGLPIVIIVVFFVIKKRSIISQQHTTQPDTTQPDTTQPEIENYREKIQEYLKQKSLEKLELLLNSKYISNDKYLGIKETLWEI
ncbi:MAG: hypothetical protein ACE5GR_05030 [Nitrosopumilus sp.]